MPLGRTARHRRRPPPGCRVLDRDLQQRMAHPTPRPQDPTRSIHLNPRRGGSMKQTRTLSNEPGAVHQQLGIDEDDGMLPLQLIAKQVARLPADLRGRVKGLTGGDALELDPLQVIGDPNAALPNLSLKVAVDALDRAAEFLVR